MKKLQDWLGRRKTVDTPLPDLNVQTALGALLVRMAKSDHNYQAVEVAQIDRILAAAYHLDPIQSAKLRAECERLEHYIDKTEDFSLILRESLPYEDRLTICDAVWAILMADGIARLSEKQTMEHVEKNFGISHTDSYVIRHKDTPD